MSLVIIRGGTVIDATGERRSDVVIDDGRIVAVGEDLDRDGAKILDAGGCIVSPGFVDLHTHLREPGREEAETVETGSRGAALGGFTAVVAMPNTDPVVDSASVVREVLELGRRAALCDVRVAGAITIGRKGDQLAPFGEMADLGVQDNRLMRRALEYATGLGVTLAQHCEDEALASGGHMNEGEWSSRLGIPGQPPEAEELMVMRDIALARLTGGRVHFQHLSTAGSAAMVQAAKAGGLPITAEVTPHHLTLTDERCATFDPVYKVNPPLRTPNDVEALRFALAEGTIDAIGTDHAPHEQEWKELPFDQALPGMLGLETALAVLLTELDMPIAAILAAMSWQPAAIAGIADEHGGPISEGRRANLCVVDPTATWTVDAASMASRSFNSPFAGRTLTGRVRHTVFAGDPVVVDGEAQR